jgi:hypothetical protein
MVLIGNMKREVGLTKIPFVVRELMNILKPCPFCGFVFPEDLIDCIYPRSFGWRAGCNESMGGCTAEVLGETEEEAIQNWNKRIPLDSKTSRPDLNVLIRLPP